MFVENSENLSQFTPLVGVETGGHRVVTSNPWANRNKGLPSHAPGHVSPCQSRRNDTGEAVTGYCGCKSEPVATVALGCFHSPTPTALVNDSPEGGGGVESPGHELDRFRAKAKFGP